MELALQLLEVVGHAQAGGSTGTTRRGTLVSRGAGPLVEQPVVVRIDPVVEEDGVLVEASMVGMRPTVADRALSEVPAVAGGFCSFWGLLEGGHELSVHLLLVEEGSRLPWRNSVVAELVRTPADQVPELAA